MKNNHVELNGTLTKDIELYTSQKGNFFTKFSLNCLKDGEEARSDYVGCIAFDRIAKELDKVGSANTKLKIIGNLQTSSYTKDNQKIYSMNVVVEHFEVINE